MRVFVKSTVDIVFTLKMKKRHNETILFMFNVL